LRADLFLAFFDFQIMNKNTFNIQFIRGLALTVQLGILTAVCSSAWANSNVIDFNYSPSQADMLPAYGFGLYSLPDSGTGFYLNGSISGDPGETNTYTAGRTCQTCGASKKTQFGAAIFSIGTTIPLVTPDMNVPIYRSVHAYGGIGYGQLTAHSQYAANYGASTWYDDPSKDKSGFNGNLGVIFGFNGFAVNVGLNSLSKTLYLGLGFNN
jgi:hypothetical protein